jgi:hypothetical protein
MIDTCYSKVMMQAINLNGGAPLHASMDNQK